MRRQTDKRGTMSMGEQMHIAYSREKTTPIFMKGSSVPVVG